MGPQERAADAGSIGKATYDQLSHFVAAGIAVSTLSAIRCKSETRGDSPVRVSFIRRFLFALPPKCEKENHCRRSPVWRARNEGFSRPMVGRTPKNTVMDWIEAAQRTLVDEGIAGLKVDRLASRLGVTRGGFYHSFKNRNEFFNQILRHWEATCRFLPEDLPPAKPADAVEWFDFAIARLIESDGYDYQFDLSVREWARADKRAEWAVERADRERLETLQKFFEAIGYPSDHAAIRARVFYYHQIGYYAIGVRQSSAERRRTAHLYIDILCGKEVLDTARTSAAKARKARVAA